MLTVVLIVSCATVNAAGPAPEPEHKPKETQLPIVELVGIIDFDQYAAFKTQLDAVAQNEDSVLIHINSPGGSVVAGMLISEEIEASNHRTICLVDGYAMSMAMYILASCDVRLMTERSVLMIHRARVTHGSSDDDTQVDRDNASMFEDMQTKAYLRFVVSRMKISYDDLMNALSDGHELYMDSSLAIALGAVDAIAPMTSLKELHHSTTSDEP